ncbi:NTP transferase domain-containing protein [Enterococcus sp. LJL98]
MYKVDNAIIMAAGLSSRFAPISYEYPKALLTVKGEVLIERQITQLKEKGIHDITIVVGYKKELFYYLTEKYNVVLIENPEFSTRNNHSSLYYVREKLKNTYICCADNYFLTNVFETEVEDSYYSADFEEGNTKEWTLTVDENDYIKDVQVGGHASWVMLGHVFFSEKFSKTFISILEKIYRKPETRDFYWEDIYVNHLDQLSMKMKRYDRGVVFEFDSLDELRVFDPKFRNDTGSKILEEVAKQLEGQQVDITGIQPLKIMGETVGFQFKFKEKKFEYMYQTKKLVAL